MTQQTRTRNNNRGMIKPNTQMPVRVLGCEEGKRTHKGTPTLKYTFSHLISLEEFQSTIFENSAPLYISEEIIDAVLPRDMVNYSLEDLVDKGLMVEVTFKNTDTATFINVVKVLPLKPEYHQTLQELLDSEKRARKEHRDSMLEIEKEMEGHDNEIEEDDSYIEIDEHDVEFDESYSEDDIDYEIQMDEQDNEVEIDYSEDEDSDIDFEDTEFNGFTKVSNKSRR